MSKRVKSSDSLVAELQRRTDESGAEVQSSRTELQRMNTELARARSSAEEIQSRHDAQCRDNKQLAGSYIIFKQDTVQTNTESVQYISIPNNKVCIN